jgi:hypothetical protein
VPLGSVTDILLDEGASPGALDAAAGELYDRLAAIRTPRSRDGSSLPGGKALSPVDAASCIRDARRTAVFLRGVNEAIRRFAGRPIELVYAGTGPFAPLAVPLMPRLPAGVRFTFIDAHAESIDCLAAILGRLGLRGTLVIGDAARYRHPTAPHVVIAEVMQRALSVEGQVAITRNLAPQLAPGGIFVPRRVTVDLAVADPQQPRTMQRVGRIVNLTAATARRALPPRRLRLPAIPPGHRAAYATRVVAYGRHALEAFESGLTQPAFIWHLGGEREVCFRYDETASAVTEM